MAWIQDGMLLFTEIWSMQITISIFNRRAEFIRVRHHSLSCKKSVTPPVAGRGCFAQLAPEMYCLRQAEQKLSKFISFICISEEGRVWYCKFWFGHTMVFRYLAHKSSDLSILVDFQQWIQKSKTVLTRAKAIEWLMGTRLSLAPCTTSICFPVNRLLLELNDQIYKHFDLATPSRLAAS